jgi:hypothetical protein
MSVRGRNRPAALITKVWRLCWLDQKTEPECTLDSIDKAMCTPRTRIVVKGCRRRPGLIVWVERRCARGGAQSLAFSPMGPPSGRNTDTALHPASPTALSSWLDSPVWPIAGPTDAQLAIGRRSSEQS